MREPTASGCGVSHSTAWMFSPVRGVVRIGGVRGDLVARPRDLDLGCDVDAHHLRPFANRYPNPSAAEDPSPIAAAAVDSPRPRSWPRPKHIPSPPVRPPKRRIS